jgi:pimeloyl-ACP methyl ester carboxylesterase
VTSSEPQCTELQRPPRSEELAAARVREAAAPAGPVTDHALEDTSMLSTFSKDGTKIVYDRTGQGPAVVLVSGSFSYRRYPATLKLVDLLAEHFTVYNYDRRGRGDSEDTPPYAVEREIEDLQAVLDVAGGSANVWGLSSGAVLVLKAAARGLNIEKLALQEPPLFVDASDWHPPTDWVDQLRDLIAADRRDDAIKYFMVECMGAPKLVITIMHVIPGAWRKLKAVAQTLPYDAQITDGHAGKELVAAEWRTVTMPTLVMAGTESPAFLRHDAADLAGVLANGQLLTKKGLGHTKALVPKVIAQALVDFFVGTQPEAYVAAAGIADRRS